jgi:hypothetical protein
MQTKSIIKKQIGITCLSGDEETIPSQIVLL